MNISPEEKKLIKKAVGLISKSKRILFVTGAGISADSGLPTYRGVGGLYNNRNTKNGIPIEQALSGEFINSRPDISWSYISQIEKKCRGTIPNRAHLVIAWLEKIGKKICVFTQNIDSFHQQAGSSKVIDIHGDIHKLKCVSCDWHLKVKDYRKIKIFPPPCPKCGAYLRPDVIFFGETLPIDKLERFQRELSKGFDLYLAVGTTAVFPYILEPLLHAKRTGMPLIEINPGCTNLSSIADIKISMGASSFFKLIENEIKKQA